MPLEIKLTKTPYKYLQTLDKNTKKRISDKLKAIAEDCLNVRHSQPLQGSKKRKARVGDLRIIFEISDVELIVADIAPRGQVYRKL